MKRSGIGSNFAFVIGAGMLVAIGGCAKQPAQQTIQNAPASDNVRSSKDVVRVSATGLSIPAGGSGEATIALSISPGYHINANPATFPYLIATQVTAGAADGIIADKPIYPSAEKKKFAFAAEPLAVYEGQAQIRLPLRAEAKSKGSISVPVNLRVQACDQEKCFPPDTLNATIPVEVK